MSQREYDEYEVIETDHDEAQVLDAQMATQADEHFMSYEQEQAYIRSIDKHVNVIYPSKAVVKKNETKTCPECNGIGGDFEDNIPCVICDGSGLVPVRTKSTQENFFLSKNN